MEKEKLTKEIEAFGLWTSKAKVEDGIKSCTKQKGKKAALKLQINFRRKVLGQTHPDKAVFQFSHNQKQYTIAQLKNLLLLIGVIEEPEPSNDGGIQL